MKKPTVMQDMDMFYERLADFVANYENVTDKYAYIKIKPARKGPIYSRDGKVTDYQPRYDFRVTLKFKDSFKELVRSKRS